MTLLILISAFLSLLTTILFVKRSKSYKVFCDKAVKKSIRERHGLTASEQRTSIRRNLMPGRAFVVAQFFISWLIFYSILEALTYI